MTGLRRSGRHVVMASTGTGAEMTQSCGVSQDPGLTKPGLVGKYDELGAAAWLVSCEHLADVTLGVDSARCSRSANSRLLKPWAIRRTTLPDAP